MFDRETFSKRLKARRAELGWDQQELADHANIPRNTLALYERGSNCPGFDKACALADALGVSVAYLVEPIEEPRPVS